MKQITNKKGAVFCNGIVWQKLQAILEELKPSKVFILVDENTSKHCFQHLSKHLHYNTEPERLIIPAGEQFKTIETCLKLWEELSQKGADRSSLILNLGGGVITDLGGFIASTFKRGITFINIPTSLLAMVDASIGGKNGVDLGSLKNQIGVINNPKAVIIDTEFLNTLPKNELTSGYAEMLKHGLIHSKEYWDAIQSFDITNKEETENAIWGSIEIKNKVVTIDPTEQNERKALNYGHTLGHAIESYCLEHSEKQSLLHGEAIAIGMILTCYISSKQVGLAETQRNSISKTILSHFPKVTFLKKDIEHIIELLKYDKKNKNGNVLFVLLSDYGVFKTNCIVSNTLINEAFEYYKNC